MTQANRPPRIALMGEFSAGKSTLCNILMNGRRLPEKVTATQLPPVWITQGPGQHVRVDLEGGEHPVDLNTIEQVPIDGTLYVRLFLEEETLEHCDFIDFPGISDPNMDPDVWTRLVDEMDAVIWLTHATQAWRQSEASAWDYVPDHVREKSLLLLTRWDKLTNELDRARVLRRVQKETAGLFGKVLPISLVEAIAARDDYEAWDACGAAALMDHVVNMIADLNAGDSPASASQTGASAQAAQRFGNGDTPVAPEPARPSRPTIATPGHLRPVAPEPAEAPVEAAAPRIIPRRVRPNGSPRRARPDRAAAF